MSIRHASALTVAAALLLAGCGTTPVTAKAPQASAISAQATKTLKEGFGHVHAAAFQKLDVNADGDIDEYEAGPYIDLRDMGKADGNHNGKLSNKEFMDYATRTGIFGWFHTDQQSFFSTYRSRLLKAFTRLDANKDMLLVPAEMTDGALTNAGIALSIDGLKTTVKVTAFSEDAFKAADKTGDGRLGQAEFEDYALATFINLINPKYVPAPPAPPSPAPFGGDE